MTTRKRLSYDEAIDLADEHWDELTEARSTILGTKRWSLEGAEHLTVQERVKASLEVIEQAFQSLIEFEEPDLLSRAHTDLASQVSVLIDLAREQRIRRRSRAVEGDETTVTFQQITSRTLKQLREASGKTQEELAADMHALGFTNWARITVAESEGGKKRTLRLEELAALAILFDCPVAFFLTALEEGERLEINERLSLAAADAQEVVTSSRSEEPWLGIRIHALITGKVICAEMTHLHPSHPVAPAGETDDDWWRPAHRLWKQRLVNRSNRHGHFLSPRVIPRGLR